MGCLYSKSGSYVDGAGAPTVDKKNSKWTVGTKWQTEQPMTRAQLQRLREEFWDTQPAYGGDKVIWDALKAACEAAGSDLATARLIIDTAGIIVAAPDMSTCYDERGAKYELPPYVLCEPTNLQPE